MFKSFTIKNFRGFENLTIDSLARINLITGKNNVGKTSLLEALFLLLGGTNPQLTLVVNAFRGFGALVFDSNVIWKWLFFHGEITRAIEISCLTEDNTEHSLLMKLQAAEKTEITSRKEMDSITAQPSNITTAIENRLLNYLYFINKEQKFISSAEIMPDANKIEFKTLPIPFPQSIYITNNNKNLLEQNAKRLSDLRTTGQHLALIEILQILDPRIEDLSVEYPAGIVTIYAYLKNDDAMPVVFLGDGINRLLSILLAIIEKLYGPV